MKTAVIICALALLTGCGKSKAEKPNKATKTAHMAAAKVPPKRATPKPTLLERALASKSFSKAIAIAKPVMADARNNPSRGAMIVAMWGAKHRLDVNHFIAGSKFGHLKETSYNAVMKPMPIRSFMQDFGDQALYPDVVKIPIGNFCQDRSMRHVARELFRINCS